MSKFYRVWTVSKTQGASGKSDIDRVLGTGFKLEFIRTNAQDICECEVKDTQNRLVISRAEFGGVHTSADKNGEEVGFVCGSFPDTGGGHPHNNAVLAVYGPDEGNPGDYLMTGLIVSMEGTLAVSTSVQRELRDFVENTTWMTFVRRLLPNLTIFHNTGTWHATH